MTALTKIEAYGAFSERLQRDGLRSALAHLLLLTDYRFIAIFRFENGKANSAVFYDREQPDQLVAGEVPDTATYCCFVRDSGGIFTTADSMIDKRLAAHPARQAIRGYCGVPVTDADGALLGTLCHYDLFPRDPRQLDFELLLQIARSIGGSGHVPPYPAV